MNLRILIFFLSFYKLISTLSIKIFILIIFLHNSIPNSVFHIHINLPTKHISYSYPFLFCNAYKFGSNSHSTRKLYFNPFKIKDDPPPPTHSVLYSHDSGLQHLDNKEIVKNIQNASNPTDLTDLNVDTEAIPGEITESDIWKMKAAISQNATLGIDWVKAIETLQTSSYCTVSPLTIAYNSALSAAEKNCNPDLSLDILSDMKKNKQVVVDSVSYKLVISCCVKSNRPEDAIKLQEEALENGISLDHGTIKSMLWLLSRNGYGHQALKLFDILKKIAISCKNEKGISQIDYIHTIESCILSSMFGAAKDLYNQLKQSENYKLDSRSLKTLLDLAYNLSDSQMCIDLYNTALKEKEFKIGPEHYKLIINTLLLTRNLDIVDYLWKNVSSESIQIDPVLCQHFLQAYSYLGNFQKAYDLIRLMDKEVTMYSSHAHLEAIKACEKCGEWKLALKILRMAQQKLGKKDINLYNKVLEVCLVAREWNMMTSLYKEILNEKEKSKDEQEFREDGDTIALMLIAYYNLDDQSQIKKLLEVPTNNTPLLSKIRNYLTQ